MALGKHDLYRVMETAGLDGRASFAGQDLAGIQLATHWLLAVDFNNADLRGADLRGARLDGCDFTGAKLGDADLAGASLHHVRLGSASLAGADLRDADLTGAILGQADLRTTKLRGAWFDQVELGATELPENWQQITRLHVTTGLPYDRHDILAAARRDLADDDPDAALATLQRMLTIPGPSARVVLDILQTTPTLRTLPELRSHELPPDLSARIDSLTTPPSLPEIAVELARLAGEPLATCRARGLLWTITRVVDHGGIAAVILLRQVTGIDLQRAKTFASFTREQPEIINSALQLAERGELDGAAALLSHATDELDFDHAVRTLWCLREALR